MKSCLTAPLLSRVKSWQLIGLGISGWCALYSIAFITWGTNRALVGHTQGGCFAITMALAGCEARRYQSRKPVVAADPLQWVGGVSTERLNQSLAQFMQRQAFAIEHCRAFETELGFGIRAVKSGRTMMFETGRWREPVIDLAHVNATEENRKMVRADVAVIVGAGTPNKDAHTFIKYHPIRLFLGDKIKNIVNSEKSASKQA